MAQLKARRIKKTYLALVLGEVAAAVGPHRGADRARPEAPDADGGRRRRPASTTGYRVRERFAGWTLLELDLVTGRTHQIRVHLEAIGHPVAGDPVYGTGDLAARARTASERLFLHAWRLELTSPSDGHLIRAEAPLPDELERVLDGSLGAQDRAGPREPSTPPVDADDAVEPGTARRSGPAGLRDRGAPGAMLVIISGPSGVGKDTIIDALRGGGRATPDYHYVVTCTTRAPRPGEVDGVRLPLPRAASEFLALRDAGGLLEANEVHGNWYGTPRDEVRDGLAAGQRRRSSRSTSRAPRRSRSRSPRRS